mmetsp:Transcript_57988/g.136679  ORF Transcript_57988/g.136679 Transcript_57988/m.136679 type:complete len:423 (-) Transcript_57988:35-1303(-)
MMDEQAKARVHRIGQRRYVLMVRLVTPNTVEEKIIARADARLRMDDLAIETGLFNLKSSDADSVQLLEQKLAEDFREKMASAEIHTDIEINELLARSDQELEDFAKLDAKYDAKQAKRHEKALKRAKKKGDEPPPLKTRLMREEEVPDWVTGVFAPGTCVRVLTSGGADLEVSSASTGVIKRSANDGRFVVRLDGGGEVTVYRSELTEVEGGLSELLAEVPRGRKRVQRSDTFSHEILTEKEYERLIEEGADIQKYVDKKKARMEKRKMHPGASASGDKAKKKRPTTDSEPLGGPLGGVLMAAAEALEGTEDTEMLDTEAAEKLESGAAAGTQEDVLEDAGDTESVEALGGLEALGREIDEQEGNTGEASDDNVQVMDEDGVDEEGGVVVLEEGEDDASSLGAHEGDDQDWSGDEQDAFATV